MATNNSINTTSNELDGLLDVVINTPTNGQGLIYNTSTSKWENSTISGGITIADAYIANRIFL